ncbi:acyl-CoA desaturase 3-like [Oppia nitens]|uniref:acyl-CoA desaturase 3-like n=1 Tax=Oppia nitens TaxID=1686743 RepID=UPI0023DBA494|nr:acyl-CoA desaturase 3-like [Oppia nitens]
MSVGGHRLWAHRSFKARLPLKVLLLILQTTTLNGSALSYARDHRTHHKWTDREQDPKNPSRGLFYSHYGWWLLKKQPIVKQWGRKLNYDDLYADPMLVLQHRYYTPLAIVFGFIIPTLIPWLIWSENPLTAFLLCGVLRTCVILNHLFTVNSIAHYVGWRPYDRHILPTENRLVIYLSLGEGNHNYHHTFPWDYSSSEQNCWEFYNPSTFFIKSMQWLGMAYDLKRPTSELVAKVVDRKGIPEYFGPIRRRHVCTRLVLGLVDWIVGILVSLWPVFSIVAFKAATGQDMIIIDHRFEPYVDWMKNFWFTDNFIVYC